MIKNTTAPSAVPITAAEQGEEERVRLAYAIRRQSIPAGRYARTDAFTLCSGHEREQEMAAIFRSEQLESLAGMRILDVGWRRSDNPRQMVEIGPKPRLKAGIDLLEDHINAARRLSPEVEFFC